MRGDQSEAVPFPLALVEQKVKSFPNVAKKAESGTRTQPLPERGIVIVSKDDPALG